MLKLLKLAILFLWVFSSCDLDKNNYPNINFDFTEGTNQTVDTLRVRVKVEIILDSNQIASWRLNGENITRSNLLPTLEEIQLSYPERKRHSIRIDLGIDKNTGMQEFLELRDSLRIGNYLRAAYLNADHQRLSVSFPYSDKIRSSKIIAPPPPPPGIEASICLCCGTEGKFTSYLFNRQSAPFENYADCMQGRKLKDCYTYVHAEKDKFYWEGQAMPLVSIADSLQQEYANCLELNRFFIILKIDSFSKFESYLKLYALCKKHYADQLDQEALKMFGSLYQDLPRKNKRQVIAKYPILLVQLFETED